MSPFKTFGCKICGQQAPERLRKHGTFEERQRWLRYHRKEHHPKAFKGSIKKGLKTRRKNK